MFIFIKRWFMDNKFDEDIKDVIATMEMEGLKIGKEDLENIKKIIQYLESEKKEEFFKNISPKQSMLIEIYKAYLISKRGKNGRI